MARDFDRGFEIAVYARTVYVRRVVEREGVIKFLTVRNLISPGGCRKASVHTATFSHFRHIERSSGWVGCRRGVETAPGLLPLACHADTRSNPKSPGRRCRRRR